MAVRPKTLSHALLGAVGTLCVLSLTHFTKEIANDFAAGWISESIGEHTGIEEARVKAILAVWLPAMAIIAAAMWITFVVTRWRFRDAQSRASVVPETDREALAREAEDLSDRILELVAEYEGRITDAFHAGAAAQDSTQAYVRVSDIEGQMLARYAMKYNRRVEGVINEARKLLSFNDAEYWHYKNLRAVDLVARARYISKIATDLRRPGPDVPEHRIGKDGKLEWANRVDSVSFGLAAVSSPQPPHVSTDHPAAPRRARWPSWWRTGTTRGRPPG